MPFMCFAQSLVQFEKKDANEFAFVPNYERFELNLNTKFVADFERTSIKKNTFLFSSGWLLQGWKYTNSFDQFSSSPLFDSRNYAPETVSDYNRHLESNYFTLNQKYPFVW